MDWLSKVAGADFFGGDSVDSYKNRSAAISAQNRPMTMPMAVAWIGYQKFSGLTFFMDGDSADPCKNRSLARSAQNRTMTMPMAATWIGYQKFSGPKKFWMAILLIHLKTDRFQDRLKPDR